MSDWMIRAMAGDGFIKASAVSGRGFVERARQIHHTLPTATAALGRTLAAASMLGDALKEDGESVTIQIKGNGPLGRILAVSDNQGNVRGYVENPAADPPRRADGKLDVGAAVGPEGTLTVIRDLRMKEPYTGSVELLSGEIAEDLAAYFAESEQVPTACALGVLVDRDQSVLAAGGCLIQLLPGAPEDLIGRVERNVYAVGPVTAALRENPDPEELLRRVLDGFAPEILERRPVEYRCDCSRDRMEAALIALGPQALREVLEEQGGAELGCQFCGTVRTFSRADLERLLAEMVR